MPTSTGGDPIRSRPLHLFHSLFSYFGPQHWWPGNTPWEVMVGAILTQNTAWTNVEKAINALKRAHTLSLPRLAILPRRRLESLIRSSGYFRQKAKRLQEFARHLKIHSDLYRALCGRSIAVIPAKAGIQNIDRGLDPGFRRGDAVGLRQRLLVQKGIGPETADSILLYAGGYPVFVVDAYTRRIGQRVGLFKTDDYHDVQTYFERAIPRKAPLYNEFHALLVMLGKHFCTRRNPRCSACPVQSQCAYGKEKVSLNPTEKH